mmetsp:Transcript_18390/g.27176  ORF Transcript_18390/g.27176 Transcript_18390/m.27176 type:complete len:163 (+) Transcript_18390:65-553(+)
MKVATFLSCIVSACAFLPTPFMGKGLAVSNAKANGLRMSADVELGVGVETGNKMWDPMGFMEIYKQNSLAINPHPQWLQESEIKHGRICMLAFVGTLVIHAGIHIPNLGYTSDWYNSFPEFVAKKSSGPCTSHRRVDHLGGVPWDRDWADVDRGSQQEARAP